VELIHGFALHLMSVALVSSFLHGIRYPKYPACLQSETSAGPGEDEGGLLDLWRPVRSNPSWPGISGTALLVARPREQGPLVGTWFVLN